MIKEYFKISVKSLRTRPVRSWLTILGIVIGVFLIVSIVSLGEGIKTTIMKQLKMMGGDLIMVMPGEMSNMITSMAGGLKLSNEDIKAIEKADGVDVVVPTKYMAETMKYGGEKKLVFLYGIPFKNIDVFQSQVGWSLQEGRWPLPGKNELIVGNLVPEEVFPGMRIETMATISGRDFKVVGILKSLGSKQDDQQIGIDLEIYEKITGEREGAAFVMATIKNGYNADQVAENIKNKLEETRKKRKGEDASPFSVITSEKITGIVGSVMGIIQLAVFAFASIGIIVGGIGIMNTMYTSVHERTREIGILKAIGATNRNITSLFLVESGIIGLIGGVGGTGLGILIAKILEYYGQLHPLFYIEASVSPFIILFGLGFSFLVGCIAGFLPARQASKLKPVDALRYE